MSIKPANNIYLFYGEDEFSLRRKIDKWKEEFAKKFSPLAISFFDGGELPETELIKRLQDQLAPSLFSAKRLIIIRDGLPKKADQENLINFLLELPPKVPKDFFVVFWQSHKPDGRLKFTKQFVAQVTVTEFNLPAGRQLDAWLMAMAKTLGATLSPAAADTLARFLGRDLAEEKKVGGRVVERQEAYDLWQAYSELLKLSSNTNEITPAIVEAMVRPKLPESVFAVTDKITARDRLGAFSALEDFITTSNTDEKSALIKIVALLAEQTRALLTVALLVADGLGNDEIAAKLGWTSGRVFMTIKNSRPDKIGTEKLKTLLAELLAIEIKLKSSGADPKLLVDLFLVAATRR